MLTHFTKYALAHTAKAMAEKGEFSCMGRLLKPLSLFHRELLEETLGEDIEYIEDLNDFALLEVASQICSQEKPTLDIGVPETELELASFTKRCESLDLDAESVRFGEYVRACVGSQPRLVTFLDKSGKVKDLRAPYAHIVVSQILTMTNGGVQFDDLLYRWPIGKTMWLYWSLRELKDDQSHIAPTDEPVVLSDEEKQREESIALLTGRAIALRNKRAKDIVDPQMLAAIERETAELIRKIEAGEVTEVDV